MLQLVVAALALLLFAGWCFASLLRMDDKLLVIGFLVPLEACEERLLNLVISLSHASAIYHKY